MPFADEPTIYLDVSQMLGNRRNTGIQRVVRCLSLATPEVAQAFRRNCRLVQAVKGRFYRLRAAHLSVEQPHVLFRIAERRLGRKLLQRWIPRTTRPVEPTANDVLLTLNATWDDPEWIEAVQSFYRTGFVASVLYDLTPLNHPQFHTPQLTERFSRWLTALQACSHHWVGISRHVASELQTYLARQSLTQAPSVSFFRLGCDFPDNDHLSPEPRTSVDSGPRPELLKFLTGDTTPTLLLVGTLEPRKNHVTAFDAVEKLWADGWAGKLLVIGRPGWQQAEIVRRLNDIEGPRCLWLPDANDRELRWAYRHASALVFPSWEEGFGLPIVEALQQGLGVLASAHPVHREVAGRACDYFPADNPRRLAHLIQQHSADQFQTLRRQALVFRSFTWGQSARHLIADVLRAASHHRRPSRLPSQAVSAVPSNPPFRVRG